MQSAHMYIEFLQNLSCAMVPLCAFSSIQQFVNTKTSAITEHEISVSCLEGFYVDS